VRVYVRQAVARRLDLRAAHVLRPVNDLALQVRLVNHVEVYEAERADAGRGEVEAQGRPQTARADHQHAPGLQAALPLHTHLRHDEVTAVARDLRVRERRERVRRFQVLRRADLFFQFDAARDCGNDHDGVAVLDGRREAVGVAYVFVADVDVDEVAQLAAVVVEVTAQVCVRRG
jgi:hypothetical protein